MEPTTILVAVALVVAPIAVLRLRDRLLLSRAKHRSLAGHSRIARRIARLIPSVSYGGDAFFASDGAPPPVVAARRSALEALSERFRLHYPRSIAATRSAADGISDLQFTGRYRVPFQYAARIREALPVPAFVTRSSGVQVTDLDGNSFYDLTGSYGVNLLGIDFYKACIEEGAARVRELGPMLGMLHPCVAWNVQRLRAISGLDEVSFHMSGTEAIMQAVRLARYHTGRTHLVRFCGAYHGWWEDVQPGVGNPLPAERTYTLKDMHEDSLRVLDSRRDIACVLVNPLQALHPNSSAPADSALIDSARSGGFDRERYSDWLRRLREVCSERGIVLILDEVFVGFRLAPGGAQEYFGIRADMVTYGKTLGGGLPVGVLCGKADLMKRFRDERPADICFARGTFNSHPYVMAAMQVFLQRIESRDVQALFKDLDERWNARARQMNARLAEAGLPLRVVNLSSIWSVVYTTPCRYNWMLQFYLRDAGIALSWVGTGRLIFSLNYSDEDFAQVVDRFVAAGKRMRADGWWWTERTVTNRSIRRAVALELLGTALRRGRGEAPGTGAMAPDFIHAADSATDPSSGPEAGTAVRANTT